MDRREWSHTTPCENCLQDVNLTNEVIGARWTYKILKSIGKGAYGTVYKGRNTEDQTEVAMKFFFGDQSSFYFDKEASIMKRLNRDDNLFKELFPKYIEAFKINHYKSIVMELLPMPLSSFLGTMNHVGLTLTQIRHIMRQMFCALQTLEECGIVHSDIKPHNIMITPTEDRGKPNLKLIDYGCAKYKSLYDSSKGTVQYSSPESLLNQQITHAADVFSTALVSLTTFLGKPFNDSGSTHAALSNFEHYLGEIPQYLLTNLSFMAEVQSYFKTETENGVQIYKFKKREEYTDPIPHYFHPKFSSLDDLSYYTERFGSTTESLMTETPALKAYIKLIRRMMDYNIKTRIKPKEALESDFMRMIFVTILQDLP